MWRLTKPRSYSLISWKVPLVPGLAPSALFWKRLRDPGCSSLLTSATLPPKILFVISGFLKRIWLDNLGLFDWSTSLTLFASLPNWTPHLHSEKIVNIYIVSETPMLKNYYFSGFFLRPKFDILLPKLFLIDLIICLLGPT